MEYLEQFQDIANEEFQSNARFKLKKNISLLRISIMAMKYMCY